MFVSETEHELKLVFRHRSPVPDVKEFLRRTRSALRSHGYDARVVFVSRGRTVSGYWDTAAFSLSKAGMALRVRSSGVQHIVTLKARPENAGADTLLRRREETTVDWPPESDEQTAPAPEWFTGTPVQDRLQDALDGNPLQLAFTTDVCREVYDIRFMDGARLSAMLDRGRIRRGDSGTGPAGSGLRVEELELELTAGTPERLFRAADILCGEFRLGWGRTGKAERGLCLAGAPESGIPVPERAEPEENRPLGGTAAAAARNSLDRIVALARCFHRFPEDPDTLHDLRVEIRHLRSLAELLEPGMDPDIHAAIRRALRRLIAPTADLREVDMLLEAWRRYRIERPDDESDSLGKRIRARQAECRITALRRMDGVRWAQALLTLSAWSAGDGPAGSDWLTPESLEARLAEFERDVRARAATVSPDRPAGYHPLRVRLKRLRNLSALFCAVLRDGGGSHIDPDVLRDLQDTLGRLNDTLVNLRLLDARIGKDHGTRGFRAWLEEDRNRGLAECESLLDAALRREELRI